MLCSYSFNQALLPALREAVAQERPMAAFLSNVATQEISNGHEG